MAFCINPSVPRVCSAVLHSPCPPSWQHCPLPPTPAALYGTHTSLPCPFPRGVLTSGQVRGLLSKPSGLLAPQAEGPPPLWHPYSSVTHQAGSKQTPKVPLPRAATAAQAPLHPRGVLSELLKPSMALHVSVFIFIMSVRTGLRSA